MRKGYRELWNRLGWIEKTFLFLMVAYALLRVTGLSPTWQFLTALAAFLFGSITLIRLTYALTRKAIWRLRNRLIAAYLLIAVVPIVLIVTLAALSGYLLIGQVAAYFVRTELANRERNLLSQAEGLSRPGGRGPGPGPNAQAPSGGGGGPAAGAGPVAPPPGGGRAGAGGTPAPGRGGGRGGNGGYGASPGFDGGRGGRFPGFSSDPEAIVNWSAGRIRQNFTDAEILVTTSTEELRYPSDSKLTAPPPEWGRASGLVLRDEGGKQRIYMWAHVLVTGSDVRPPDGPAPQGTPAPGNKQAAKTGQAKTGQAKTGQAKAGQAKTGQAKGGPSAQAGQTVEARPTLDVRQVTIIWPVSSELLARLDTRLNYVWIEGFVDWAKGSRLPPPVNIFDISVSGWYPLQVSLWESPSEQIEPVLFVRSRLSSVLGIIFESKTGQQSVTGIVQTALLVVAGLFLFVEVASLWAGIKLSHSMTGAVHEIYQGTLRVKEGDFSYRIAVKGNDQLAEMGASFNTMTENLGQLIVVAKEKERLQSELEIAREVQNQLFPRDVPSSKSLELKGVCNPARVVSGDYYDFMAMPGSELAFAIGDVAGKGISAALLMATIQSAMRTQLSGANGSAPAHYSAAVLVAQLNRQLYNTTTPEKYATFFFAIYDEALRALTYTNAGHLPPMLMRSGEFTNLNPTGTVVGAFPFAKYEERTVQLEEGDIVVAYTDGIVEPENPYGEMFGENRLKELILRYSRAGSSEIIARTMEAVNQWTGSSELQDDMTMIVARRV